MREEGTRVATTSSCDYRSEHAADVEAGKARHRAAVDAKGRAGGIGPREAFCAGTCETCAGTCETGCTSIANKTCRICTDEACAREAGAAVNRCDEAGNARTDEARATATSSSRCEAQNAGGRDRVEPNTGSDCAQGAAQVNQGNGHHDQAVVEESGGRSAGRIP